MKLQPKTVGRLAFYGLETHITSRHSTPAETRDCLGPDHHTASASVSPLRRRSRRARLGGATSPPSRCRRWGAPAWARTGCSGAPAAGAPAAAAAAPTLEASRRRTRTGRSAGSGAAAAAAKRTGGRARTRPPPGRASRRRVAPAPAPPAAAAAPRRASLWAPPRRPPLQQAPAGTLGGGEGCGGREGAAGAARRARCAHRSAAGVW